MTAIAFSQQMKNWLKSKGSKTFGELETVFQEKSFAVAFFILMAPSALPIPTGGITHIFSLITMLLAIELIAGRRSIWLPQKWRQRNLGKMLQDKALPKLVGFIAWFEKRSKQRLGGFMKNSLLLRLLGIFIFIAALAATVAPPFSGLDTLPALSIVLIALALILDDALILPIAVGIGVVGVGLVAILGRTALHLLPF